MEALTQAKQKMQAASEAIDRYESSLRLFSGLDCDIAEQMISKDRRAMSEALSEVAQHICEMGGAKVVSAY